MPKREGNLSLSVCIILVVLAGLCAGCLSGSNGPNEPVSTPAAPANPAATVTIRDFSFSPQSLTVKAGNTVTWTNLDSAPHTIESDSGAALSFTSPRLATGASFQQTFPQPGTFAYHCSLHPSMHGTIVVEA